MQVSLIRSIKCIQFSLHPFPLTYYETVIKDQWTLNAYKASISSFATSLKILSSCVYATLRYILKDYDITVYDHNYIALFFSYILLKNIIECMSYIETDFVSFAFVYCIHANQKELFIFLNNYYILASSYRDIKETCSSLSILVPFSVFIPTIIMLFYVLQVGSREN